jgi:hypothetical protein
MQRLHRKTPESETRGWASPFRAKLMNVASRWLVALIVTQASPLFAASNAPHAVSLAVPAAGKAVLNLTTPSGPRRFSLAELEALGMKEVTTHTFWPADDGTYQGPLLSDVLKRAGIENARAIRVTALDGFSQAIPREDWSRWPLLLATRRDGQPLATREKGPLRVIYPRDTDPRLEDTIYRLRWIWLVRSIAPE